MLPCASYITAASTPKDVKYGYIFNNCKIIAAEGVSKCYLGRPWRPYGKSVFVRCDMGSHICPKGWHNWNKKDAERTCFFAEYGSMGEGSATQKERAKFGHQLKNLRGYSMEEVLAGSDGWNPLDVTK